MSVTDGIAGVPGGSEDRAVYRLNAVGVMTLAGNLTMDKTYRPTLRIDPGGSARDVLLPAEEHGLTYRIINAADAAENLVVKEDSDTTTIATINQNEAAEFWCDGTTWYLVVLHTAPVA